MWRDEVNTPMLDEKTSQRYQNWIGNRWLDRGGFQQGSRNWHIAVMGLAGETGEIIDEIKKIYRDGKAPGEALKLEMGDALHYLTVLAHSYGWSLEELMRANVAKLVERDAKDPHTKGDVR
jgi:NTP pyrophosphatase (non-canonical NTP hydrolase)